MSAATTTAEAKPGGVLTTIDVSTYDAQLVAKRELIEAQFAEFSPPELEVFRSSPENYRMR
jgi:tRNA (uracil-5-)-methyltransferase